MKHHPKSNGKVCGDPQGYEAWRRVVIERAVLHDSTDDIPTEQFLQTIWQHQRLLRDRLRTTDGIPVTILHPGFWNREAGPDFRQCILQFEDDPPVSGDIEIDLRPCGWHQHGHDRNRQFRSVVLHVVWEESGPKTENGIPRLTLRDSLDSPLEELAALLGLDRRHPPFLTGRCAQPFQDLTGQDRRALLEQAARARLRAKAQSLQARARQVGWNHCLLENLFSGLGYKQNSWPMRLLADRALRLLPDLPSRPITETQSLLLGLAGMLPADLIGCPPSSARFVRNAWDIWWRERTRLHPHILPGNLWRQGGLRPANQPQRRIALAAYWLTREDLASRLEQWLVTPFRNRDLAGSLHTILRVESDPFWSHHWTFHSTVSRQPRPLLGLARTTDLTMNILLPWLWIRAGTGRSTQLQRIAIHRYLEWPAGQDNAALKHLRQRLFGQDEAKPLNTAALQQGLLQIARDFCEPSNALCEHCPFPDLLAGLGRSPQRTLSP